MSENQPTTATVEQEQPVTKAMLKIDHEPNNNRFVIYPAALNACYPGSTQRHTEDECAKLTYVFSEGENGVQQIDFNHTFCPVPFRGPTGISELLVRTGLTWATKEGYAIKASCWYVDKFLPFVVEEEKEEQVQ